MGVFDIQTIAFSFAFRTFATFAPFLLALFLDRLEFGPGFFPFLLYPNSRYGPQASFPSIMYLVRGLCIWLEVVGFEVVLVFSSLAIL